MGDAITRRHAVAVSLAVLCGVAIPTLAIADEKSEALQTIEELIPTLSDEDIAFLSDVIESEKNSRGIQRLRIGTGTYICGKDIDPGSYAIRIEQAEPDKDPYVQITIEENVDDGNNWSRISWDLITDPEDYNVTMTENMRMVISAEKAKCIISPAKKISF